MPALKSNTKIQIADILRRIILSWLLAVLIEYLILPSELRDLAELDGLAQMSFARVIGITCGIAVLLTGISSLFKTKKIERWCIVAAFAVLAIAALRASATWAFLVVCVLVLVILAVFGIYGWEKAPEPVAEPKKAHRVYLLITVGLSAVFFLFVSAWTVGRVYSFSSPTFDFSIFSQMFYNMKESGLPMTTVERDGLLSHFAVHVSPIYYLMLPFYWLVPTPATLQVLQAAVITSAVIPLWKIGKHHGLTGAQRMLVCAVLLLYPAFSGGTSYDIHENCFLTPLILWLLYGIDKKSITITTIAAVLTLMVKEDGVYIRAHAKSLKKAKAKLKELTSRSQGRNVRKVMENVKIFIRGWLGYFGIANMKTTMQEWDGWLRRRYRCYIWKQWKKPRTRAKSLMQLGIPEWQAWAVSNCRKAYWHMAKNGHIQRALSKERLAQAGYYSILDRYESLHLCD